MKRILKYVWLVGLLAFSVSSCEEEAAIIDPDVAHDKPTETVLGAHQGCVATGRKIISRYFWW